MTPTRNNILQKTLKDNTTTTNTTNSQGALGDILHSRQSLFVSMVISGGAERVRIVVVRRNLFSGLEGAY